MNQWSFRDSENSSDEARRGRYHLGMDALPFQPVELAAVDAARNLRRRWSVVAYRDLFGQVLVETCWGRIGSRGRTLVHSFSDDQQALRYVRTLLARRGTAQRRIGASYLRLPDR
jgi:predicted DNA-binding WGR domain protein